MIKVYSNSTCNNCTLVKNYLRSKGIKIEIIDVTDEIAEDLCKKGFSRLPVIECNGDLYDNCSKENLDKAIERELKGDN